MAHALTRWVTHRGCMAGGVLLTPRRSYTTIALTGCPPQGVHPRPVRDRSALTRHPSDTCGHAPPYGVRALLSLARARAYAPGFRPHSLFGSGLTLLTRAPGDCKAKAGQQPVRL